MIILLATLLFYSTKIKDEKIANFSIGLFAFTGFVLSILELIFDYPQNMFFFNATKGVEYLLIYIWSTVVIKFIIDVRKKQKVNIDWKSFAILSIVAINFAPISIITVLLLDYIFAKNYSDIDYHKRYIHFYGLYFWIILILFGNRFDPSMFHGTLQFISIVLILGIVYFYIQNISLRRTAYTVSLLVAIREALENYAVFEISLFAGILIFFLVFIWTVILLELDGLILSKSLEKNKIEKFYIRFKLLVREKQNLTNSPIIFKNLIIENIPNKTIWIKNVIDSDIRINMILIFLLITILTTIFHLGPVK